MQYELLKDIVVIFLLSTSVNFLFTKIKTPTIIGYLLTGIIAGPYVLKLISDQHDIEMLAEVGVVMLMFSIGLEFSLNHLFKIRKVVFLGGLLQLTLTTAITALLSYQFNLTLAASVFTGFLVSLSSTAVVLKLLQERSELTSNSGRTVLGILIFQDLILIPLMLITPMLAGQGGGASEYWLLLLKSVIIFIVVFTGNKWIMPKLLHAVAMTKNQELFFMSILLVCLSVALFTSWLGLSLAFGAFLAGLMISDTEYSHSAFSNIIPFKDTFTSFFFVSIGMLLNVSFVIENWQLLSVLFVAVIIIKTIVAGGTAFVLGHTFIGTIVVGLALSQVGEFSFILAQSGVKYHLLSEYQYQLFLAVAIGSMAITPLNIRFSKPLARRLLKLPLPKVLVNGLFPLPQPHIPEFEHHVVFIGKDSRTRKLGTMAKIFDYKYITITFDPATVRELQKEGENIIYGDAINEPILEKAHVDKAEIVVISVGALITTLAIIEKVREMNPAAHIIVRTKKVTDLEELYNIGANEVLPEEFETAIELFERILKKRLVPQSKIAGTLARIRDDHYGLFRNTATSASKSVLDSLPNIEIISVEIQPEAFVSGKTLYDLRFRKTFGVTLVAILRKDNLIEHPMPETSIYSRDILYLMGTVEQLAMATELINHTELIISA